MVGYNTGAMKAHGIDLRRVLYLELAPVYYPTRDNIVRLQFVDEERRKERTQTGSSNSGIPLMSSDVDFFELRRDWRELAKALFVKGETWAGEREIRLLVDLQGTRALRKKDESGYAMHVFDVPTEIIEEIYVGFNTPSAAVERIRQVVGVGEGKRKLIYTDSHAYRMETPMTAGENRTK